MRIDFPNGLDQPNTLWRGISLTIARYCSDPKVLIGALNLSELWVVGCLMLLSRKQLWSLGGPITKTGGEGMS